MVSVGTGASESIHQTGIKGGMRVINIYSCISVALTLASLWEKWFLFSGIQRAEFLQFR